MRSIKSYAEYANTGLRWPAYRPKSWRLMWLKHAVSRVNEKATGKVKDEPYIALENIESWTGRPIPSIKNEPVSVVNRFKRGDVLFGKLRPYLAKVLKVDFDGLAASEALVLRPRKVTSKYLAYYLLSPEFIASVDASTYGAKMPRADWEFIGHLPQLVPEREDQEKICSFLDYQTFRIDRLIGKHQRLIKLLDEKRHAVISHAVSTGLNPDVPMKKSGVGWLDFVPAHWDRKKISIVTDKITNGYVGPTRDIFVKEGIRYLQSLHIKNNKITFDPPYYVSRKWSEEHKKSILREGDVLVVQTGDIGQVAYVPMEYAGSNCHALIILSPKRDVLDGRYLAWILRSSYGFHSLKSIQTGALHPHLNCGYVREIAIPLPPLDEQREIRDQIDRMTSGYTVLRERAGEMISFLEERRSALISAAVTGKIDVRNWKLPESANEAEERDHELLEAAEQQAGYG